MKDLEKYITESIFDEEDNIESLDTLVEMKNWIKKLSNANSYVKTLDDIEKVMAKKSRKVQTPSDVMEGQYYIAFYKDVDNYNYIQCGLWIYYPYDRRGWKYVNANKAIVKDTKKNKRDPYLKDAIHFTDFKLSTTDISMMRRHITVYDAVYVLPAKYYKLIDLISEAPDRIYI